MLLLEVDQRGGMLGSRVEYEDKPPSRCAPHKEYKVSTSRQGLTEAQVTLLPCIPASPQNQVAGNVRC
jgi:hypothetical protein